MTSANGPEPGTRTRNPLCGTRPPNRSSNASPATAPPSIIRRPPDGQNTNITTLQPDRTLGGLLVASPDRSNAMDHVVVLMFENRSFDNLLGRLYEPGEVQ